jgi:hypothetical protein
MTSYYELRCSFANSRPVSNHTILEVIEQIQGTVLVSSNPESLRLTLDLILDLTLILDHPSHKPKLNPKSIAK